MTEAVQTSENSSLAHSLTQLNATSLAELQNAFTEFASMSAQLSESYQFLEKRVVELSGELASLSRQRLNELNEKEQIADQLASLLRIMPAAVLVLDNRGVVVQSNPAADHWICSALDEPVESLIGRSWRTLASSAFAPKKSDYHEVSLRDNRLVSLATSPLDNLGQMILMTDQTETRELQTKVARQERLSAMGKMVASLAHQIRTPLSAALLYAENLSANELDHKTQINFLEKLTARLHHMEKNVRDMLLFVKGEVQLTNVLTVQEIEQQLMSACDGLMEEKKQRLHWQLSECHERVLCQQDVLISALMNVVNNALEIQAHDLVLKIEFAIVDSQLTIRFSDNGPGMDSSTLEKIHEPFFTTKSHGSGLGIPVLLATVKAHQGRAAVQSTPGAGTEILITLPIQTLEEDQ